MTRNAKRRQTQQPVQEMSVVEAAKWQQDADPWQAETTWQPENANNYPNPQMAKNYQISRRYRRRRLICSLQRRTAKKSNSNIPRQPRPQHPQIQQHMGLTNNNIFNTPTANLQHQSSTSNINSLPTINLQPPTSSQTYK